MLWSQYMWHTEWSCLPSALAWMESTRGILSEVVSQTWHGVNTCGILSEVKLSPPLQGVESKHAVYWVKLSQDVESTHVHTKWSCLSTGCGAEIGSQQGVESALIQVSYWVKRFSQHAGCGVNINTNVILRRGFPNRVWSQHMRHLLNQKFCLSLNPDVLFRFWMSSKLQTSTNNRWCQTTAKPHNTAFSST